MRAQDGPYTTGEVARLFGVDAKTVARWDRAGKLPGSFRTLGTAKGGPGHRRFDRAAVDALLAARTGREA